MHRQRNNELKSVTVKIRGTVNVSDNSLCIHLIMSYIGIKVWVFSETLKYNI